MREKSFSIKNEGLLTLLNLDSEPQFSRSHLQKISNALSKVPTSSSLDHEILRKIFERLRSWSFEPDVHTILPLLAQVYEDLLRRDYSRWEVLDTICELLFLIEDMADSGENCKLVAGEHFSSRLLYLAGAKATHVKLQRAAVETLSSLIAMCPSNQRIMVEELTLECAKLVKHVLPSCGDFFVQASIVEIFYRLSKRSPQLLDLLEDEKLRQKMYLLHQAKKPDVLGETRAIVNHLNQSLGQIRSVYSFLAEDIIFDGHRTPLKQEKWVHFGTYHISCYGAADPPPNSSTRLVDIYYNKVTDFQKCSHSCIEISMQESLQPMISTQDDQNESKGIKISLHFRSEELSIIMGHIIPRISHLRKQTEMIGLYEGNSENTSTTPGISAKSERSFKKASVGFAIPLPKKFKLPTIPRSLPDPNTNWSNTASEYHKIKPGTSKNQTQHCELAKCLSPPGSKLSDPKWEEVFTSQKADSDGIGKCTLPGTKDSITSHPHAHGTSMMEASKPDQTNVERAAPLPKCKLAKPDTAANGKFKQEKSFPKASTDCTSLPLDDYAKDKLNSPPVTVLAEQSKQKQSSLNIKDTAQKFGTSNCATPKNSPPGTVLAEQSKQKQSSLNVKDTVQKLGTSNCATPKNSSPGTVLAEQSKAKQSSLNVKDTAQKFGTSNCATPKNSSLKCVLGKTAKKAESGSDEGKSACKMPFQEGQKGHLQCISEIDIETQTVGIENVVVNIASLNPSPISNKNVKETPLKTMDDKPAEMKQTEQLRNKILQVLNQAKSPNFVLEDRGNQKASTSDPIESDSEHNNTKPENQNQAGKKRKMALSNLRFLKVTDRKYDQREEKGNSSASKQNTLNIDAFCFETENPGTVPAGIKGESSSKIKHGKRGPETSTPQNSEHNEPILDNVIETPKPMVAPEGDQDIWLFETPRKRRKQTRLELPSLEKATEEPVSPMSAIGESFNAGDRYTFLECMAAQKLDDNIYPSEENDEHNCNKASWTYRSPKQLQNERARGSTARSSRERTSRAKSSPSKFKGGKTREREDRKSFFLPEGDQVVNYNDGDFITVGAMQLLANLIHKFTKKLKAQAQSKSDRIVTCTAETIERRYQEVQCRIESDVEECVKLSKKRFGELQMQLQDEHDKLNGTQQKWKHEFCSHLQRYDAISSQVEDANSYLKGISDKQKLAQRQLLAEINEFTKQQLTDAEQKLVAVQKAAKGLHNELKGALIEFI